MRHVYVAFLCMMIASCNFFNVKKTSTEAILNEELKSFNWNEVDEFPTFSSCDSLSEKSAQKKCFENVLSDHILKHLSNEKLVVSNNLNDTMFIDFNVSAEGELSINNIQANETIQNEIPEINHHIKKSINSLPQIFPAIKRGQQVDIRFKLPVIIKAE